MSSIPSQLKKWTQARIGLNQAGVALSTSEVLQFKLAHALAKDAVLTLWDYKHTAQELAVEGRESLIVASKINSRHEYLQRPDLGRKLSEDSRQVLSNLKFTSNFDLVFIISDGLSATALQKHLLPLWSVIQNKLKARPHLKVAPLILAPFSRVAIGDEIGSLLRTRITIMLIGERPGLSAPDSLGVYITYNPNSQSSDADRNCISNIRSPHGLEYEAAAQFLFQILESAFIQEVTGVRLLNWHLTALK